jgi:hypothetical protein
VRASTRCAAVGHQSVEQRIVVVVCFIVVVVIVVVFAHINAHADVGVIVIVVVIIVTLIVGAARRTVGCEQCVDHCVALVRWRC